jgi:hypothetical protein
MSGPVSFPVTTFTTTTSTNFRCLSGFIVRAEPIGFIQRGTHRLLNASGQVIAALRSDVIDLTQFEGQFRTVCGLDEGQIEGVTSLLVTQVLPVNVPGGVPAPQPSPIDLRLLLLVLLLRPDLLQGISQSVLISQLQSAGVSI